MNEEVLESSNNNRFCKMHQESGIQINNKIDILHKKVLIHIIINTISGAKDVNHTID